jgi:hypothetical protein
MSSSTKDLKKENDRLLRELSDACLQIVNVQNMCRKIHARAQILEGALASHLTQDRVCSSLEEAKKMVTDTIREGLAEKRAHEWTRPFDEETFDD